MENKIVGKETMGKSADWFKIEPNYDSSDFVADIIKEGESLGLEHAKIVKDGVDVDGQDAELLNPRDCNISWITKEEIINQIARLYGPIQQQTQYNIDAIEALQYTVYDIGHYYDWHIDNVVPDKEGRIRKFTFTMWLNEPDEYEGGELQLELGGPEFKSKVQTFREDAGTLVFFHPTVYHRVTPITKGVRKALVGWFCGTPWK